jgi:hypothetical protein
VRVDADSGELLARREAGRMVYDVEQSGSFAIAILDRAAPTADRHEEFLVAYRAADLTEAWKVPFDGFPDMEWIAGSLYAVDTEGEGDDSRKVYRRVETESGRLGPSLPARVGACADAGLTWELQVTCLKEGKQPARLRRNSMETGQPLWTAELPGDVRGWARDKDALYLHCDHVGGRGYFLVLDWATGAIRHAAYGLRDVRGLFSAGDKVVAWQEEAITAFAARSFGLPEAGAGDVREEVARILRGVKEGDVPLDRHESVQAAVTDLETLGPDALPFVAEQVPRLDAVPLVAAARVLGNGQYRNAAAALAARLADRPPARGPWGRWDPAFDVLGALSRIAGDEQLEAIAAVLNDATRDGATRRQALATLGSIGTDAALRIAESALQRRSAPEVWWHAPSPEGFAELIGRTDLEALEDKASAREDWPEVARIEQARSAARVPRPGGGAVVLFHDSRIGGPKDLWLAELDEAGRISPGLFVGGFVAGPIKASFDGDAVSVEGAPPAAPLRIVLSELRRDGDGDGLTDRVEARLGLDPSRADTDGDGIPDSQDPAPNAAGPPQSEEQEITLGVFQQFFMFESSESERSIEAAVMVSPSPLEWVGRPGPTITLDAGRNEALIQEAGTDGIAHILIGPGRQTMGRDESGDVDAPVAPDERWYKLTIYRGGLNAVGYDLLVRRFGKLWVMKECRFVWVS